MPDIHIERQHTLGLAAARGIARQWVRQAEQEYGMACSYDEGEHGDTAHFSRAGIEGSCEVTADAISFRATLGFLYSSFSEQIEQRLTKSLEGLMGGSGAGASVEDDAYNDKDWK